MNSNQLIFPIASSLQQAIANFRLPSTLTFGSILAPIMARSTYSEGQWSPVEMGPYENLSLSPACRSFHYGQLIFEGLKAYRHQGADPLLFRPTMNLLRFNQSAERMAMPSVPEQLFMTAITSLVYHLAPIIPQGEGESLYLRPLMMATETGLGLRASSSYLFLVLASPAGAYFQQKDVRVLIERDDSRAVPGGTGAQKVAGNYGASIRSSLAAQKLGYNQTLWLDAIHKRYIEEFSGMNFFAVINGELYTPALNSSILPGVTRDSLLQLAPRLGIKAHEEKLAIDEVLAAVKSGACSEIFACGTAAVVSPIAALGEKEGTLYPLRSQDQPIANQLRTALIQVQKGLADAPAGWTQRVPLDLDA